MARTKTARKTVARPTKPRATKTQTADCWTGVSMHASAYPDAPGTGELQVEVERFSDGKGKSSGNFGFHVQCRHWPTGPDKIQSVDGEMHDIPIEFLDALPAAIAAAIANGRRAGVLPPR